MVRFNNKSASKEPKFVVVQHVPAAKPATRVGPAWDLDAALRIFSAVVHSAPKGYFNPHSGASIRVVAVTDWNQSLLAAALLES